jgi:hypothetical protein
MNVEIGAEAAQFPEKDIYKLNCLCSVTRKEPYLYFIGFNAHTYYILNGDRNFT